MKIINQTKLLLSPIDAIKALLGKAVHITTEIEVTAEVEVIGTQQSVYVDRLARRINYCAKAK